MTATKRSKFDKEKKINIDKDNKWGGGYHNKEKIKWEETNNGEEKDKLIKTRSRKVDSRGILRWGV